MVTLMKESKNISWINRIKDLLVDNPKDKKDLISLLETAVEDNLITQDSYQMILGVFSVSEIPVREIMIPRPHMIAIDVNDELNTVITKVIESGHSRFPVINGKLDEIIGILHAKDLLKNQINMVDDFDLHDYMRPATLYPKVRG
jgi:magnesium and cobalt transporter